MALFQTPILFLIFNRPERATLVFEQIKKIKPEQLFIAADGPRDLISGEQEICEKTRKIILDGIDWNCKIHTLFRQNNLGCRRAVSEAITWFFQNVSEGIILEDDCLPDISFFSFCEELLARYRNDMRVMHINGTNLLFSESDKKFSYYFSKYPSVWGWASWARAWEMYDADITNWPDYKADHFLADILFNEVEQQFFSDYFDLIYSKDFDTWDFQWIFANFFNHGAAISPSVNLVSNIGFGPDATHTHNENKCANVAVQSISKINHPPYLIIDQKLDKVNFNTSYSGSSPGQSKTTMFKLRVLALKARGRVRKLILNAQE